MEDDEYGKKIAKTIYDLCKICQKLFDRIKEMEESIKIIKKELDQLRGHDD